MVSPALNRGWAPLSPKAPALDSRTCIGIYAWPDGLGLQPTGSQSTLSPAMLRGIRGPLGRNALRALRQFAKPLCLNREAARALHVLEGLAV